MTNCCYPKDLKELRSQVLENKHILVSGAQTSTVIPFSRQDSMDHCLGDSKHICLQSMAPSIKIEGSIASIAGAVSWKELRAAASQFDLDVPFWPTDQSAFVISGIATSATGERSFHYGHLRDYIDSLSVMNHKGEVEVFYGSDSFEKIFDNEELDKLGSYNKKLKAYDSFKNPPFPIFENPLELFIGTEGQLGIIVRCELRLVPKKDSVHILYPIAEWEKSEQIIDYSLKARDCREYILSTEFFDRHCLDLVEETPLRKLDHIAFEVIEDSLAEFICDMDLEEDFITIVSEDQFSKIRVNIPRAINEYLSHNQMTKKGTDVQVTPEQFSDLISKYRDLTKYGISYILFGHLGDQHLHFNFLVTNDNEKKCQKLLSEFYQEIRALKISPFAEHGIGLLKQEYMTEYYTKEVKDFFMILKNKLDPNNKFFPQGYMSV